MTLQFRVAIRTKEILSLFFDCSLTTNQFSLTIHDKSFVGKATKTVDSRLLIFLKQLLHFLANNKKSLSNLVATKK